MLFTKHKEPKDKSHNGNKTQRVHKKSFHKSLASLNRPVLDSVRLRNYSPISMRSTNSGMCSGTHR